jgi:hypothetical protein
VAILAILSIFPLFSVLGTEYTFTSINVPGAYPAMAQGINDSGDIVGSYGDATGGRGDPKKDSGCFSL